MNVAKINGHQYAYDGGTSDCAYGCGCWMGPSRSGGPDGIDPFGFCPCNPHQEQFCVGLLFDPCPEDKLQWYPTLADAIEAADGRASRDHRNLVAIWNQRDEVRRLLVDDRIWVPV